MLATYRDFDAEIQLSIQCFDILEPVQLYMIGGVARSVGAGFSATPGQAD